MICRTVVFHDPMVVTTRGIYPVRTVLVCNGNFQKKNYQKFVNRDGMFSICKEICYLQWDFVICN